MTCSDVCSFLSCLLYACIKPLDILYLYQVIKPHKCNMNISVSMLPVCYPGVLFAQCPSMFDLNLVSDSSYMDIIRVSGKGGGI